MERYLLFDSGCSVCTGLAQAIERESNGWLTARSLRDAEMQALLKETRPEWRWEPTLLEVDGARVRVFTGLKLRARVALGLGPKRAWRVAELVQQADSTQIERKPFFSKRRQFLKGAAIFSGALMLPGRNTQTFNQIPPELSNLTLLSKEEGAQFVDIARSSVAYQSFNATLGDRFVQANDVAVMGNNTHVLVTFAYDHNGKPFRASFIALIDKATSAVQQTIAFSLEDVAQGAHTLAYSNGQLIVDGIQNTEGTFISGWAAGGMSLVGQNRVAEGEAILQQYKSAALIQRAPSKEADGFLECVVDCLNNQMKVPATVANAIAIACPVVCAVNGMVACVACGVGAAGLYGWAVTICGVYCGCGCSPP
jgi:hypothetical protein